MAFAPVLMKGYGPASDKSLFKNYFKGWNTLHDFCPPVYSLEMSKLAVKSQSQSADLRNCDGQRIFQSDLKWFCIALQMFWSINNRNREIRRKMRYVWTLSRTKHTWLNTHDQTHMTLILCASSVFFPSVFLRMFIICTVRFLKKQFTQMQEIKPTVWWRCTAESHVWFHYIQPL